MWQGITMLQPLEMSKLSLHLAVQLAGDDSIVGQESSVQGGKSQLKGGGSAD